MVIIGHLIGRPIDQASSSHFEKIARAVACTQKQMMSADTETMHIFFIFKCFSVCK